MSQTEESCLQNHTKHYTTIFTGLLVRPMTTNLTWPSNYLACCDFAPLNSFRLVSVVFVQTQKTSSDDIVLWRCEYKCGSSWRTNTGLLGSRANTGALIQHPSVESAVFHLFRWLMSTFLQCGLQRKLSVSILSIHSDHLSPSSTPQAYKS